MEYVKLGKTELSVSKLCFGGLVIGPLQVNLSEDEGAEVIVSALKSGVNFIDTAELYKLTYNQRAIEKPDINPLYHQNAMPTISKAHEKALREPEKNLMLMS